MILLITRPRYETPTHYLFHWAEILVMEAKKRGWNVLDLQKEKAKRNEFQSYLNKKSPDIVILNGHGNAMSVMGQDGEIILSTNDGVELLEGKKVFIRACSAGLSLGREAINKGANGFVGYIQPFIFLTDKDSFNKPLEDVLAKPFFECSNQVGLSLIKEKTVEESNTDSLRKYEEKIRELSHSESKNSFLLPFLVWNMSSQVCYTPKTNQ